jgi:peptidoglycan/xylan/chitin deacetylase (PgdA/CDA1 family)
MVSLTFDDGPDAAGTPRILDELAGAGVTGTFFVVAEQLAEPEGPDLVRAILAGGHRVEAHCARHLAHDTQNRAALRADIEELLGALEELGVERPRLWRPPYGLLNRPSSFAVAEEVGLQLVLWTSDPRDYRGRPWPDMLRDVARNLHPDSVILMHDSRRYGHTQGGASNTAELIRPVADLIRERGFKAGPLEPPLSPRAKRVGEDAELVPADLPSSLT